VTPGVDVEVDGGELVGEPCDVDELLPHPATRNIAQTKPANIGIERRIGVGRP
jgi:hypothetical protein